MGFGDSPNVSADTQQQIISELMAALGQKLLNLSAEEIACLHGKKDQLAAKFGRLASKLAQPEAAPAPEASVLTVEVVAEFPLGGQNFDAVRVKWTGETRPTREKAIRAADTDGNVVRMEEEWDHVYEHRRELPKTPNAYCLTARSRPCRRRGVSVLFRDDVVRGLARPRPSAGRRRSHSASSHVGLRRRLEPRNLGQPRTLGPLIPRPLGYKQVFTTPFKILSGGCFLFWIFYTMASF